MRVVDVSACVNASKMWSSLSGGTPMPVSRTDTRSTTLLGSPSCGSGSRSTRMTTSPWGVNLSALLVRFISTCRSRPGSPCKRTGTASSTKPTSSTPRRLASSDSVSSTASMTRRTSKSISSRSSLPASIFEKSRTSFSTAIRLAAHARARSRKSRRSSASVVSSASSVIPKMPFIGVRISWLIVARNSDFASDASSARRLARSSSSTKPTSLASFSIWRSSRCPRSAARSRACASWARR